MSSRLFMILVFLGTVAALTTWLFIIILTAPEDASLLTFMIFYSSLFLTLVGVIFLVGSYIREKFMRRQLIFQRLSTSLRHGIFFATLIVGWALLQSRGIASWWIILLLIVALTMLEFFFISANKNQPFNEG